LGLGQLRPLLAALQNSLSIAPQLQTQRGAGLFYDSQAVNFEVERTVRGLRAVKIALA
jgi:hypothetical protein